MMIPDAYRPAPKYPTYPPYHQGLYLEDYFYEWSKGKTFNRTYIPIFWTSLYCDNSQINIQNILNRLDPTGSYFTICQHDDAPRERLPKDTLVFSASGNVTNEQTVPIPVVCSPILNPKPVEKTVFASFLGTDTHRVRRHMHDVVRDLPGYVSELGAGGTLTSIQNFERFKDLTQRSRFTLCPRGYGRTSFRLFETMQLGSIPVYISDVFHIPWIDLLDWSRLAIFVNEDQINDLPNILNEVSQTQCRDMLDYTASVYRDYFTLDGVCEQIMRRVNR